MFFLRDPGDDAIRRFLESQGKLPFTYPEVGATREVPPPGYVVDRSRVRLGQGEPAFRAAVEAFRRWEMFRLDWVRLLWPDAPIAERTTVGIFVRHFGFYSLNACRIVYVVDEPGRFGFAYGTLPGHAESGEERFLVTRSADDQVEYEILAFSRPHHLLARVGYPVARTLQRRFARGSLRAMERAVA